VRRKIYVASSWRNEAYSDVVKALREDDHAVFDFRNPVAGNAGFQWEQIDREWKNWDLKKYVHCLETHPTAAAAFKLDEDALHWCDTLVLVLPCGRSAHLEAGFAAGQGKTVVVMLSEDEPPQFELMYLLCSGVGGVRFVTNTVQLCTALRDCCTKSNNNFRIRNLAERAWALSNGDFVRAVEILREWTGLSFDLAFEVIDEVRPPECADLIDQPESEPL
jgi:hypothetical protein